MYKITKNYMYKSYNWIWNARTAIMKCKKLTNNLLKNVKKIWVNVHNWKNASISVKLPSLKVIFWKLNEDIAAQSGRIL